VLAIYSKSGGKGTAHSWVPTIPVITAASYIAIQVYEHHFGLQFYEKPPSHAFPQLKCFDMISSNQFLYALKHVPEASETGFRISTEDFNMFNVLKAKFLSVTRAVSDLSKRKKSAEVQLDDE
jgi:hypothetical protein